MCSLGQEACTQVDFLELLSKPLERGYSQRMACMAYRSVMVVNLTFGEVYDTPLRAPKSRPGFRPEPKKKGIEPVE